MFYFLCLLFMYYLYEKYYKLIPVQYYRASCVSQVPGLTLLDLRTNEDFQMHSRNGTHSCVPSKGTYCIWLQLILRHCDRS